LALNDLALSLLDTTQHGSEIPEAGLCDDVVAGKDLHLVETRVRVTVGRKLSSNDDELLQLKMGKLIIGTVN
jgi:hypothetical protein